MEKPVLKKEWYLCPACRKKLFIIDNTTRIHHLYIKCKACGRELVINKK